jgi:hypothetical protein
VAVALHGNLKDFGIAEVFQLIGQQRKTGLLNFKGPDGQQVGLSFDEGAVVSAAPIAGREHEVLGQWLVRCGLMTQEVLASLLNESEASARSLPALILAQELVSPRDLEEISVLLTGETIFEVLRWTSGSFHFSAQSVVHDRPPEKLLAAEQILMDGLRMVDEWQTFCQRIPPEDTVFGRCGSLDSFRQRNQRELRGLPQQVDKIFQLVDGRLTLRRVIDLSRLGVFEATRAIAELTDAGLIAPLKTAKGRSAGGAAASTRSFGQIASRVALAAVPLVVLASMIGIMNHRAGTRARVGEVFPIERPALTEVQASFEKRRLRHAIEANRFLVGEWPSGLDAADATGLLGRDSLAPGSSAPYYYAIRENEIILLTPEH